MVRKRKKREDEQPPWCYYCDRVFSDEPTLVQHQKAKHFKCTTCHKRLTSAGGLRVHCHQVHRFALEKVPFAKPGKDSMDLEVFGMAGVPEGAMPGVPPPDDEAEAKSLRTEAALVPAPLPHPGTTNAGAHLLAPQQHFMQPPAMQPHFMPQPPQPGPGPPLQFAPMPFPGGMPAHMLRPPPGVAPPPGFMMPPGTLQQLPQGQMQAQRPLQPLFPAGSGIPARPPPGLGPPPQAQPLFPAGAGPTLQTQQEFPPGQGPAPQASNSGLPVMPHEPEPAKGPAPTLFPGGGLAAVQQPTSSLPASDASDLNGLQHTSIPQHAPGQHDMAGAHQMPGFQHMAIPPHMQAHMQPRSPAGSMTPNGDVHMTPQAAQNGPLLDTSNPAVIWKAIDMSMEESRAQHAKYQQKLSRATQAGMG
ncbi:hypothetical protein CVIRNUC_000121 [Coccomyxa viridis]|uniref:Uncharacterized protein n=1 Tax=Coccomyxa viridis TaxID=1274662 RepID=A0AAV1HT82_9CHLO|nr:hypothetical protein CVIRNUC_000121 [Coccomyxa viridis]